MNGNKYLNEFLMFYSQSDLGNGLSRGLETDLAKRTYVKTKLDLQLAPAILEGKFRLVILTGNAGDGKTAFIQMVESLAHEQGVTVSRKDSIGSTFKIDGRVYRTLYDGSVDSEDKSNMEMLSEFFKPFEGTEAQHSDACLIVAMNEGKLRDFLSHSTKYQWLGKTILDHFRKGITLPRDMVVVNLNLRSVVNAASEVGGCLFDDILDRYVANEFWTACETCPAKTKCPVKFNVDTFRYFPATDLTNQKDIDATNGRNQAARVARIRLKTIFQILHFRKRHHVTVRDLRSILALTLFGKRTCDEIMKEVQSGKSDFKDRYYYNAVFNETEKERVLEYLREFDVGKSAAPQIDSRLSFTDPSSIDFRRLFDEFGNPRLGERGRFPTDESDLKLLYDMRPRSPEERNSEALGAARLYVVALRRKLFFEGDRKALTGSSRMVWDELVPYDNLSEFMGFIANGTDGDGSLKAKVVEGISRSEGIYEIQRAKENICIRTRQDLASKVKAFFTYPATDFALRLHDPGPQATYIEYLPSSIIFRYETRAVDLEISLDLYEMLIRIREGYLPTAGEMRTFFLNLLMFKKQLMSVPSDELLLTENDYEVFKLKRTPQNAVALSTL